MIKHKFSIGDRVRYSSKFCRLVGAHTGWTSQARGEIIMLTNDLATIHWDFAGPDGNFIGAANVFNLQQTKS